MVKKKSRRKIIKAPVPKLDTIFNCPLCGHKKTVAVTFNKKENKGYLRCKACKEEFESDLKRADTFIDIYYRWVNYLEKKKEKEEENELEQNDEEFEDNDENENENENDEENEEHDEDYENNDKDEDNEESSNKD